MSTPVYQTTGDLAKLYYSTDNVTFTVFAAIEDINGAKLTSPKVKTTKLDSTSETSQPGLPDSGQFTAKIRYARTTSATIIGWWKSKMLLYFKAEVNDGTYANSTQSAQGWVEAFDPLGNLVNNKEVISDITIQLTGDTTWTTGS